MIKQKFEAISVKTSALNKPKILQNIEEYANPALPSPTLFCHLPSMTELIDKESVIDSSSVSMTRRSYHVNNSIPLF